MSSIFADGALDRIFYGAVEPQRRSDGTVNHWTVTGFRQESVEAQMCGSVTDEKTITAPDARGIYSVRVAVGGVSRRSGRSRMFPKLWTRAEIVNAITEAYENKHEIGGGAACQVGIASSGVKVQLWLDARGQIIDAMPLQGNVSKSVRVAFAATRDGRRDKRLCQTCGARRVVVCPNGHGSPRPRWQRWLRKTLRRARWLLQSHFSNA